MELCENGNLLDFLRDKHCVYQAKRRRLRDVCEDISGQECPPTRTAEDMRLMRTTSDSVTRILRRTATELPWPVTVTDMLRMAYQIASGMEYLQSKKVRA